MFVAGRNAATGERVSLSMDTVDPDLVTVYWRPGCPYCSALRRGLRRAGLATTERNIWTDPVAAATVRSIAGGNETVPTVVIGGVGFVNPSVRTVLDAVGGTASGQAERPGPSTAGRGAAVLARMQWIVIGALVVASVAADAAGHSGASWAIDGAALVVFGMFRAARRRQRVDTGSASVTAGGDQEL